VGNAKNVISNILESNRSHSNSEIGDLVVKVAKNFVGLPYLGGTLEGEPEFCRNNFEGLDCVTFFENSLNLARMIRAGDFLQDNFPDYLLQTRYKNGIISDYSSRLHYTSDWILQNTANGIVENISDKLKGVPTQFNLSFMSQNPKYYSALKEHPELIETISQIEKNINTKSFSIIPKSKIKKIESSLKNGDIIAIATSKKGLDYSHLGIICVDEKGLRRLMHASSSKKKVVIDTTLSVYISKIKSDIGITVLRPLNPKKVKK
jgi:hypothetical protein